MGQRTITTTQFRRECLSRVDQGAATGEPLLVTKQGQPIVRILPVEAPASLLGSVTQLVDDDELIAPLLRDDEQWGQRGSAGTSW